jgi:hypothetical protein
MAAAKEAPTDVLMKSLLVMLAFREELLFIDLSYLNLFFSRPIKERIAKWVARHVPSTPGANGPSLEG